MSKSTNNLLQICLTLLLFKNVVYGLGLTPLQRFEIDGNYYVDDPTKTDWITVLDGYRINRTLGASCGQWAECQNQCQKDQIQTRPDLYSEFWDSGVFCDTFGNTEQSLLAVSSDDVPADWVPLNIPGAAGSSKYDLTNIYFAGNDIDMIMCAAMERIDTSGVSYVDFEFSQKTILKGYDDCPDYYFTQEWKCVYPDRRDGDFQISFLLGNDVASFTIRACMWDSTIFEGTGNCGGAYWRLVYEASTTGEPILTGPIKGALNNETVLASPFRFISDTKEPYGQDTIYKGAFLETCIDWRALNETTMCFTGLTVKTKASPTGSLKDTGGVIPFYICGNVNMTHSPTHEPTQVPITSAPVTQIPSNIPSRTPTNVPSDTPSNIPSGVPTTGIPSKMPSNMPSGVPTTGIPSVNPTKTPSNMPSDIPSNMPTAAPVPTITPYPSNSPITNIPTKIPSEGPTTYVPTRVPVTEIPTKIPSKIPTGVPVTTQPTSAPVPTITKYPTILPTTGTPVTSTGTTIQSSSISTTSVTGIPSSITSNTDIPSSTNTQTSSSSSSSSSSSTDTTYNNPDGTEGAGDSFEEDLPNDNTPVIIGVIVGVLLLCCCLFLGLLFYWNKKNREKEDALDKAAMKKHAELTSTSNVMADDDEEMDGVVVTTKKSKKKSKKKKKEPSDDDDDEDDDGDEDDYYDDDDSDKNNSTEMADLKKKDYAD